MQVRDQELVDADVVDFLGLVKDTLDSWEASGLTRRSLPKRSPFADEWAVLMNAGRHLFGMTDLESGSQS